MQVYLTTPTGERFGPFASIGDAITFAQSVWSGFLIGDHDEDPNAVEMEVIRTEAAKKPVKRQRRQVILKPTFA